METRIEHLRKEFQAQLDRTNTDNGDSCIRMQCRDNEADLIYVIWWQESSPFRAYLMDPHAKDLRRINSKEMLVPYMDVYETLDVVWFHKKTSKRHMERVTGYSCRYLMNDDRHT